MSPSRKLRIGNAGGYWGDDPKALKRQLELGPLDYITQDFLAEITMSILQKQRSRNPALGYATDFVDQLRDCLSLLASGKTRVISNAGGINPVGCAQAVVGEAARQSVSLRVALVEGDDLMDRLDQLLEEGVALSNMETGQPLTEIRDRVVSANVYLGAEPVMEALESGAQIVITGRVTDTGITCAPPALEFGWALDDWDRLAAGVVAGHILECGSQASGGNLTDWQEVPSFQEMGYPIAEFDPDGSFVITKHPQAGGMVNFKTVTSQLVYEMGDPRHYLTPDVVADFSTIRLHEEGQDRVRVEGISGTPRPQQLKVSIAYESGFKAHGTMIVCQPLAIDKARRMAEIFWKRLDLDFEETSTELVGYNACHRHLSLGAQPGEVLLRLGVRDNDRDKLEAFSKSFASLILSSVPGVSIVGARPRIQEVIAYWPCLIPRDYVSPRVGVLEDNKMVAVSVSSRQAAREVSSSSSGASRNTSSRTDPSEIPATGEPTGRCSLVDLCWGRSGDKGDTANIGVVARSPQIYEWLLSYLTTDRVRTYFADLCRGEVERFEIPNLLALNFLLHESLGGGGTVSLRIDPQGKTLADALLNMEVEAPVEIISSGDR